MTYFNELQEIIKGISGTIVDFNVPRDRASSPTQASSNFITNKEQGDWAEDLIFRAINETSKKYVAVRYGKSDDLVAGEIGFKEFFDEFQNELDEIGKRPDLLIFEKVDFNEGLGCDISKIQHSQITDYVKKAIAGLEIRSSAFLIDEYECEMQERTKTHLEFALQIRDKIIQDFSDLLDHP